MRALLVGCLGNMGKVVSRVIGESEDLRIVAGVDKAGAKDDVGYPIYASPLKVAEKPDILIDFSHPDALFGILAFAKESSVPLLIATTGYSEAQIDQMRRVARSVPVLQSNNMSLGIGLLLRLARTASAALGPDYDVEIIEKHHNRKVDAPSGTAKMMADAVCSAFEGGLERVYERQSRLGARGRDELGIHSVRGGDIVGEHSLMFIGDTEVIEIRHSALSRELFATGAIRAARFLAKQPAGFYSMDDVVGAGFR